MTSVGPPKKVRLDLRSPIKIDGLVHEIPAISEQQLQRLQSKTTPPPLGLDGRETTDNPAGNDVLPPEGQKFCDQRDQGGNPLWGRKSPQRGAHDHHSQISRCLSRLKTRLRLVDDDAKAIAPGQNLIPCPSNLEEARISQSSRYQSIWTPMV